MLNFDLVNKMKIKIVLFLKNTLKNFQVFVSSKERKKRNGEKN